MKPTEAISILKESVKMGEISPIKYASKLDQPPRFRTIERTRNLESLPSNRNHAQIMQTFKQQVDLHGGLDSYINQQDLRNGSIK